MGGTSRTYRNFIILQEDSRGYASVDDKSLSGYSKIESKGERCKISFYAQNLKIDSEKYCMMLICSKKDKKEIINLGKINISSSGKGETTKEYYSDNIAGLDISFSKISGAAIATYKDGVPVYVMCGFLNGEQPSDNWKDYKIVKAVETKVKVEEKEKETKESKEVKKEIKMSKEKKYRHESKKEEKEEDLNHDDVEEHNNEDLKEDLNKQLEIPKVSNRGKFDDYEDEIEKSKKFNPKHDKLKGSIGEYFESIVHGLEECKNPSKEIKYTKWYNIKVNSLQELCNTSNYNRYALVYYPMLNYYPYIKKHGYFKFGFKCDSEGNLKYLVYGVPGSKHKDCQPYDGKTGFVTWVKDHDNDDFGCWLMFYDFKNSSVVIPMV